MVFIDCVPLAVFAGATSCVHPGCTVFAGLVNTRIGTEEVVSDLRQESVLFFPSGLLVEVERSHTSGDCGGIIPPPPRIKRGRSLSRQNKCAHFLLWYPYEFPAELEKRPLIYLAYVVALICQSPTFMLCEQVRLHEEVEGGGGKGPSGKSFTSASKKR